MLAVGLMVALAVPQMILAEPNFPALQTIDNIASDKGPYVKITDNNALNVIIGTVISIGLGLIGIIFLVLMIYAGYNWMTASGDEEKVSKAKTIIIQSVIGIIIVVGAYAAWRFIFVRLLY
ncbi:MAG: hypothetical protein UU95_C0024G0022 [Parcubacteria group bacterium GW2011_GWC2_42_12]|nr:MAG: hypothetical protein UU43_C0001G0109 [Candidatus Falkowbacteria bacterium GW2011_GWA2_41_14]KKS33715.1 MAG: hypothetical protein UU95_C0024G0022 [Parcubacteria group bacterium GW2011_GWC2_42_12]